MNERKIHVLFQLNEAGRKDSLAKGGDGKRDQIATFGLTPEWLELACVKEDGLPVIDLRYPVGDYRWEVVTLEYRDTGCPPELTPVMWDLTRTMEAPPSAARSSTCRARPN